MMYILSLPPTNSEDSFLELPCSKLPDKYITIYAYRKAIFHTLIYTFSVNIPSACALIAIHQT